MSTRCLFLVACMFVAACDSRSLQGGADGDVQDNSPEKVDGGLDFTTAPDGCGVPAGYCRPGMNDCSSGFSCKGCYACKGKAYWSCGCSDIVPCSVCSSCIGKCVADSKICSTNKDCVSSEFCDLDGLCVVTGAAAGTCKPKPDPSSCLKYGMCSKVCGCDGKTYCDECHAHAAGVSVATKGACHAPTCAGLDAAYIAEVKKAKQCCTTCGALQCYNTVSAKLYCSCNTMINTQPPALKAIRDEWMKRGCNIGLGPCGIKCKSPQPGSCQGPPGLNGVCVDAP